MEHAIKIDSLSFDYPGDGKDLILDQLSFCVKRGELTCLLGANGAGKTTLINLLLGRLTQQQGTIEYFAKHQAISAIRERVGAMMQNSTAPDHASVIELLRLFSSYFPKPIATNLLIEQLQLTPLLTQSFGSLSGGQKQLVLLALALCGDPDILFLDEPSVGMDITTRRTLWQVIEQYKKIGKTIILTTHYLEEADALADRIVVLQDGKLVADGSPEQLKARFNQKIIRAKSALALGQIQALGQVEQAIRYGQYVEVSTRHAATTLSQWLALEPSLADISVSNADLEQAFLQITDNPTPPQEDAA